MGARAAGLWGWIVPLRRLRRKHRRFASLAFLLAGLALGSAVWIIVRRGERAFDNVHLPLLLSLVLVMVAMFVVGSRAEQNVAKVEAEIAEREDEAVRELERR